MNSDDLLVFKKLVNRKGRTVYEGYTFEGKAFGQGKVFWPNGNVYQEGRFDVKGLVEGTEYYPSGSPRFKGKYHICRGYGPNYPEEGEFYSESGELIYSGPFKIEISGLGYPSVKEPIEFGQVPQDNKPDYPVFLWDDEKKMKYKRRELLLREEYLAAGDQRATGSDGKENVHALKIKNNDTLTWQKFDFKLHGSKITIEYKRVQETLYDFHLQAELKDRTMVNDLQNKTVYYAVREISEVLHEEHEFLMKETNLFKVVYKASVKHGDAVFTALLKHGYRRSDKEDVKLIQTLTGKRVLPPLGEAFDEYYVVDVGDGDMDILKVSGYRIWHIPQWSMQGKTRDKITLNPYRREGDDAAANEAESISFEQFLGLFN